MCGFDFEIQQSGKQNKGGRQEDSGELKKESHDCQSGVRRSRRRKRSLKKKYVQKTERTQHRQDIYQSSYPPPSFSFYSYSSFFFFSLSVPITVVLLILLLGRQATFPLRTVTLALFVRVSFLKVSCLLPVINLIFTLTFILHISYYSFFYCWLLCCILRRYLYTSQCMCVYVYMLLLCEVPKKTTDLLLGKYIKRARESLPTKQRNEKKRNRKKTGK